jgi:hypothetical protein
VLAGAEQLTLEDAVDAVALIAFGLLGATLMRRSRAAALGLALVVAAGLQGVNYLLGGAADALSDGRTPVPAAARLGWLVADSAFVAMFILLLYAPLALFPTGRLPSARWRWLPVVATTCAVSGVLSVLLGPGRVDDDNPAKGTNPLGVPALDGVAAVLERAGLVLLVLTFVGGVAAYVVRWLRFRGARRRQLAWLATGVVAMAVFMVVDAGSSLVAQVVSASVLFGTLLVGLGWPLLGPLGAEAERTDHATSTNSPGVVDV